MAQPNPTHTPSYLSSSGAAPTGVDRLYGRHVTDISITLKTAGGGTETRKFFCYSSVSARASLDFEKSTNPGSSLEGYQPMRREPPTFEIEIYLPFDEDQAIEDINFLRAGRLMDSFDVKGLFSPEYMAKFGSYVIESSTIELSRDSLTRVRATVRGLGYTCNAPVPISPAFGSPEEGETTGTGDRYMTSV